MTKNQTEETKAAIEATIQPAQTKVEQLIDDPFASAYLAAATVAVAFSFVVGGMTIINAILY